MKTISRWLACLTILMLFFTLLAPVAYAVPVLPHTFYGTVKINGANAPTGTVIAAKVDGVGCGSYTTTEAGKYGSVAEAEHLVVQGDIDEGATLKFYVSGVDTTRTASFIPGGGPTELNLTVTISTSTPAPGGGGGALLAGLTTVEATLFGGTVKFSIDNEGVIQETIEATSEDGNLTMTIPEGTIALDKDGDPLDNLEAVVDESLPSPPEGAHIIGLAYDFSPAGATFDPPITLEYTYDPAEIPEGVAETDLVLAYYDEGAGKWVTLDSTVDTATHTITASVSHFSTFAILGYEVEVPPPPAPAAFTFSSLSISPSEVNIGETVAISISVANTGGTEGTYTVTLKINGVKEADKSVTVAAGSSQKVTFIVSRDVAGSYSVDVNGLGGSFTVKKAQVAPAPPPQAPPPAKPINWSVLYGVIATVIVVGLLIFLLAGRRRRAH